MNDQGMVASIVDAFERYEAALVANDVDALDDFMWRDEWLVRVGIDDRQDGFAEVQAFRRAQKRQTPARTLQNTTVVTFGDHTAVVTTDFVPTDGSPNGRQSQTWVRMPEGWRIVAAHVSWPASALRQALDPQT
jgi:ketosteroid isomerase-like protein